SPEPSKAQIDQSTAARLRFGRDTGPDTVPPGVARPEEPEAPEEPSERLAQIIEALQEVFSSFVAWCSHREYQWQDAKGPGTQKSKMAVHEGLG
ncbi:MAG TPA: hypothetical protein VNW25_00005, partial [Candidatus Sulfotelmatobacter sp.]|nr:hypothetical protein [Candidatus Sulfotelmatobacter sp.]